MSIDTRLPVALYKANLEFHLRTGRLLQESGRDWFELATRVFDDAIAELRAEVEQLSATEGPQALATLPGDAFWRQAQQRFGDAQAVAQTAIATQTAFMTGLHDALQAWQKEATQALTGAGTVIPLNAVFDELARQFGGPGGTATGAAKKSAKAANKGGDSHGD